MVKYYDVKEVADLLEVNDRTVRRYIQKGHLKAMKDGRKYIIREEDLYIFTYDREQFQSLLSAKIGGKYNLYMVLFASRMQVISMVKKNPKLLERIRRIKAKNEGE